MCDIHGGRSTLTPLSTHRRRTAIFPRSPPTSSPTSAINGPPLSDPRTTPIVEHFQSNFPTCLPANRKRKSSTQLPCHLPSLACLIFPFHL